MNRKQKKAIAKFMYDYEKERLNRFSEGRLTLPEWDNADDTTKAHYHERAYKLMKILACATVRETQDDTHPLHRQGKKDAALTASSESAGAASIGGGAKISRPSEGSPAPENACKCDSLVRCVITECKCKCHESKPKRR